MKIRINQNLFTLFPGLTVATVRLSDVTNIKKNFSLEQLLRGSCATIMTKLANPKQKEKIANVILSGTRSKQIFPEVQLIESALNKITKNRELEPKNTLYNLCHYYTLKNLIPVFGYDLDQISSDIELDLITPKQGKKAVDLNFTTESREVVLYVINLVYEDRNDFIRLVEDFVKSIKKYCKSGTPVVRYLDEVNPEIDLGYVSDSELEYRKEQVQQAQNESIKKQVIETDELPILPTTEPVKETKATEYNPLIKEKLSATILNVVNEYLKSLGEPDHTLLTEGVIETPQDSANGDFACSVALKLSRQLAKNPRDIAVEIQSRIPSLDYIQKTEIAGPGFINFYLSEKYLEDELVNVLKYRANYGRLTLGQNQKVLLEYSSPNIAKPMGAHHLLTTIIGQALSDLLRFAGYDVLALNYLGDWGTQFGKLLYAYKNWGSEEVVRKDPLNELLKLYVEFHNKAETDPTLEDKGREEFKKLEDGDEENYKLWLWIRDLSKQEVEKIYHTLGVSFDEYLGEQMFLEDAKKVVTTGIEQGIIKEGEKGALIVPFEDDKLPPYMMQKADGTTLYSTRDVASIKYRIDKWNPAKIIYVVDVAQSLHFKQLFETVKKYGFTGPEFVHVSFGRMNMPDGKMSTRKGEIIILEEMIKEAVERAKTLIAQKSPDLTEDEQSKIAQGMAVSAIKYNILCQNRETNITFDLDKMLTLEGNSGPYLQYACARACSILRKAANASKQASTFKDQKQTSLLNLLAEDTEQAKVAAENPELAKARAEDMNRKPFECPSEQTLLRLIPRFAEHVELAVKEYKPNLLGNYLFELAKAFSTFYNDVQVLNAPTEELKMARLKLVDAISIILKNGLKLLGLSVFERM